MKSSTNNTIILPHPKADGRDEFPPFLKAKDIAEKGVTETTLLGEGRQSNSQFGEGIDVACTIGGKKYLWPIKFDSGNYSRLFKRFGSDIENWKGIVKVERKSYLGREYVAVVD
jgi:hypothetical protein